MRFRRTAPETKLIKLLRLNYFFITQWSVAIVSELRAYEHEVEFDVYTENKT